MYFGWIESILQAHPESSKPFIISIAASTTQKLSAALDAVQNFRHTLNDHIHETDTKRARIAVELNTSCPNITGATVPGHDLAVLAPLLHVLAAYHAQDPTLTLGLKLPPYTDANAITALVRALRVVSSGGRNPVAFLTSANTLGTCLLFSEQCYLPGESASERGGEGGFAVPTGLGGLGGECVHALALGNVYALNRMLRESDDEALGRIVVIGVGGVMTAAGVRRMRRAGAGVVGCATALGKHGVGVFEELAQGLENE